MKRPSLLSAVKSGKILVSDGAWGTQLQQQGLRPGQCPEEWCLRHPEAIKAIARNYVEAGADMVQTNSFGANRYKLEHYGLSHLCAVINREAARLSREAAGDDHWVIASMGPTGKILMMGEVTEEDLYLAFKEQAVALAKGGADALCIETMTDIDEARIAIRAAKENTPCEVICTFTFDKTVQGDYRTIMGVSPAEATQAAVEAGAGVAGTNCGNGIVRMVEIVKEIRTAFPSLPLLVHANAGLPVYKDGQHIFPDTPGFMAGWVKDLIEAGANIIGGCCGTTPAHIQAIRKAVNEATGK